MYWPYNSKKMKFILQNSSWFEYLKKKHVDQITNAVQRFLQLTMQSLKKVIPEIQVKMEWFNNAILTKYSLAINQLTFLTQTQIDSTPGDSLYFKTSPNKIDRIIILLKSSVPNCFIVHVPKSVKFIFTSSTKLIRDPYQGQKRPCTY